MRRIVLVALIVAFLGNCGGPFNPNDTEGVKWALRAAQTLWGLKVPTSVKLGDPEGVGPGNPNGIWLFINPPELTDYWLCNRTFAIYTKWRFLSEYVQNPFTGKFIPIEHLAEAWCAKFS